MSTAVKLPEAFITRLKSIVSADDWNGVEASFGSEPNTSFRINTLKADANSVIESLKSLGLNPKKLEGLNNGYSVSEPQRSLLTHSHAAENGSIYIQDAGSMYIADLVQAQPDEELLDLAAAPGGKTLFLADAMENRGRIAAVEAVKNRFFQLQNNIQRSGVSIIECYLKDGRKVGKQVPERFDKVLIDAPCSSESRFNLKQPDSFQYWSEKKIADMQRKQKQLLYSAIQACKSGGKIVYSTCSFAPEENEAVIDRQLGLWGEKLDVVEIQLPLTNSRAGLCAWRKKSYDPRLQKAIRLLPNHEMSGFFVCVLQKN